MHADVLTYALLPPNLPSPWKMGTINRVGGCWHVGFSPGHDLLLVESTSGFSLFDTISGKQVARDDGLGSSWEQKLALSVVGFDQIRAQIVPMAGLWGGGLRRMTADGFYLSMQAPKWPSERVVLSYPDPSGSNRRKLQALVADDLETELRAYGFSDTGRSFIIATASTLTTFFRVDA
jgi:hypothetical protein